jgi:peptide/nickel transport system substrate-binding protein
MTDEHNYWQKWRRRSIARRRLLAAGAAGGIGAALVLSGCGKSSSGTAPSPGTTRSGTAPAGTPVAGGTLNVPTNSNPPTLDPQRTTSYYTLLPAGAVYSRPLRFKTGAASSVAENHDVESDLATSVESPDATTWTIKLRPDAKFHNVAPVNGHAVEAEDVKATFTRALGPDNPGRTALNMIDPAQIATPDAQTVVFKLKFPYAPFQTTLASPNYCWIFPREVNAGSYDPTKTMIGSGPFILDSYTPDVAMTFKKNQGWFSAPEPYADTLRWAVIPDQNQQRAQFVGGNLDLLGTAGAYQVSPFDVSSIKQSAPKATVVKGNPNAGQLMFMRLDDPSSPFQDIRLRQAFSLGIDRDAIAKAIYNNDAVEQFFVPLSMGKWAMTVDQLPSDAAQYYKYDPAQAKKLVQAAGVSGQQFKLIYVTDFLGPQYEQAAQTAANMLQGIGVSITPVSIDYTKDYIGGGKGVRYGNYDPHSIVFTGLSNFADVDEYIANYWQSNGSSSLSKLSDPNIDSQLSQARTLVDETQQVNAYIMLQQYIAGKVYAIAGLHLPYLYTFAAPRIASYDPSIGYGFAAETLAKMWIRT